MDNDVNVFNESPLTLSGGTITDGTVGSLTLNFTMGPNNVYTTIGSGSVTVGSKTTALNLTNFHGGAFCLPCTEEYNNTTVTGTIAPFGNATITLTTDVTNSPPQPKVVFGTVTVNASDSFNIFSPTGFNNLGDTITVAIAGGTGAYAGATGSFTLTIGQNSAGVAMVQGSGTITTAGKGAPVITSVKTAFGASAIADNTWLQINGTNLGPQVRLVRNFQFRGRGERYDQLSAVRLKLPRTPFMANFQLLSLGLIPGIRLPRSSKSPAISSGRSASGPGSAAS